MEVIVIQVGMIVLFLFGIITSSIPVSGGLFFRIIMKLLTVLAIVIPILYIVQLLKL